MSRVASDFHPRSYREHLAERQAPTRAVYLMEAIGPVDRSEWLLKIGQSENVLKRQRSLARDVRLMKATEVQCVAYTFCDGLPATLTLETGLLAECERRWARIPNTEWFRWSEEMRAEIGGRLNVDRRRFMAGWAVAQSDRAAAGEPTRTITVARGVRLAT